MRKRKEEIQALELILDRLHRPTIGTQAMLDAYDTIIDQLDTKLQRLIAIDFYHSTLAGRPAKAKLRRT